jgi:hypothetical protein
MSTALQSEITGSVDLQSPEILFSAASFPGERMLRRLRPNFGSAIKLLTMEMDCIASLLIRCRSKEEFDKLRMEQFPSYVKLSTAIGSVVRSVVKDSDHARLVQEALDDIEKKFCAEENSYLGTDEKREIMFSLAALKKAFRLLPELLSRTLPVESVEEDKKLAQTFAIYALLFQFHLQCLKVATVSKESLNPEVLEEIIEGLRGSVMAYTCIRQALELRGFSAARYSENLGPIIWDKEDETLANS